MRTLWGRTRRAWSRPAVRVPVLVLLSAAVGCAVVRLIGRVNWGTVGDALGSVTTGELAILFAVLCLRLACNAVSMARFVPGLGLWRAIRNDLSANLVATVAPPPGDVVLRVAQFRSWGVDPVTGMGGVTLSMVGFYGARFLAPVLGLLLLAASDVATRQWAWALVSLLIAVAILVGLVLAVGSRTRAERLGGWAARAAGTLATDIDAQRWQEAVVDFGARMNATLIASWSAIAGDSVEAAIIAATVLWRTVTIGGTLLLGVIATGSWRAGVRSRSANST